MYSVVANIVLAVVPIVMISVVSDVDIGNVVNSDVAQVELLLGPAVDVA